MSLLAACRRVTAGPDVCRCYERTYNEYSGLGKGAKTLLDEGETTELMRLRPRRKKLFSVPAASSVAE